MHFLSCTFPSTCGICRRLFVRTNLGFFLEVTGAVKNYTMKFWQIFKPMTIHLHHQIHPLLRIDLLQAAKLAKRQEMQRKTIAAVVGDTGSKTS